LGLLGGGTRVAALPSEMRGFFDCAFDGETVKRSAQNDGFLWWFRENRQHDGFLRWFRENRQRQGQWSWLLERAGALL